MAKTHLSLSHNPDLKGCPKGTEPTPQSKRSENELCIPKLLASMQILLCSIGTSIAFRLLSAEINAKRKLKDAASLLGYCNLGSSL